MTITREMEPTAKLRYVPRWDDKRTVILDYILQQWWSNAMNVRMGPTQMVKGEWRDVPVEEDEES